MNIIFDLDGTLIDSKLRLYRLFQYLVPDSALSYEQYWELKKSKVSHEVILSSRLKYDEKKIMRFYNQWMALIESPRYLELDSNFAGVHECLAALTHKAQLYVCTARQFREPVLAQLEGLNLLQFFNQVFVTEQQHSKESLIFAGVEGLNRDDWLVGDTGKDVLVGKVLGINTCAVLSGFLNRESLMLYAPDLIVDSVVDFPLWDCVQASGS